MRYITNHQDGDSFGAVDERSSTKMVKKITATINKPIDTKLAATVADDFSISLFPNPTHEQVNLRSKVIIEEVMVTNIQGEIVLHTQPMTFETAFELNRAIAPVGTYFAKIMTSKGVKIYKILVTD